MDQGAGSGENKPEAAKGFDELGLLPELLAVCAEQGWAEPTPIQEAVIPLALEQRDLYGIAQTGTGKTAAYALPAVQRLSELDPAPSLNPYCVVLAPTRELAQQIAAQFELLSAAVKMKDGSAMRVMIAHGGTALGPQMSELMEGCEVVVAAPGRLLDLMRHGWLQYEHFQLVVLDEADRMFDMGFIDDLKRILNRMPARRQTLLLSATMPPEIKRLTTDYLFYPEEIRIGRTAPPKALKHELWELREDDKYDALKGLLKDEHSSVLVFVKTRSGANDLTRLLLVDNERVSTIHADRSQRERESALKRFKEGELRVLVATDVASRGLDIEAVDLVVNYDVPGDPEDYVHRVGRTARAQKSGLAVTFITRQDGRAVQRIERFVKQEIPRKGGKPRADKREGSGDGRQRSGGKSSGDRPRSGRGGRGGQRGGGGQRGRDSSAPSRRSEGSRRDQPSGKTSPGSGSTKPATPQNRPAPQDRGRGTPDENRNKPRRGRSPKRDAPPKSDKPTRKDDDDYGYVD